MLSIWDLCLRVSSSINMRAASQTLLLVKPSVHLPSTPVPDFLALKPLVLLALDLGTNSLIWRCNHIGWSSSIFGCFKWKIKWKCYNSDYIANHKTSKNITWNIQQLNFLYSVMIQFEIKQKKILHIYEFQRIIWP